MYILLETSVYLLPLIVIGAWLMPHCTFGQIPTVCADDDSLENLKYCPMTIDGVCGENANCGQCVYLNVDGYSRFTNNTCDNWPHYFIHVSFAFS